MKAAISFTGTTLILASIWALSKNAKDVHLAALLGISGNYLMLLALHMKTEDKK